MGKKNTDPRIENVIIDAINSGTDVQINDGSLLESVFSERGGHKGEDSGRPRFSAYNPEARFPLLSFIYLNLCALILLVIWALYWLLSKISSLLIGKKTDYRYSVKLNGIILFTSAVVTFIAVASMMVFFIKDIMFRSPEMSINSRGAIVLQQPCRQEYYVYLMNSSDICSNTGISLSTGDKVEVSYSGSFYSDICNIVASSIANTRPRYSRSPSRILRDIDTAMQDSKFMLRYQAKVPDTTPSNLRNFLTKWHFALTQKKDKDHYGTLLWAVCGESFEVEESFWNELSFSKKRRFGGNYDVHNPTFTADRNGILYFSVNDGYEKNDKLQSGSTQSQPSSNTQTVNKIQQWSDNLGELLLTVKVSRRVPSVGEELRQAGTNPISFFFRRPFSWMTASYRWLEHNVNAKGILVFFIALSALFAADHWTGRLLCLRRKRKKRAQGF